MSVQDSSVIDFVSVGKHGEVILTISDHLDWTQEAQHLRLLEDKINAYCTYIESGQLYDEYPEARDKRPLINVVVFHRPTPKADEFFAKVKTVLETEGFGFEWKKYVSPAENK